MAFLDRFKTTARTQEQERLEEGLEKTRSSFFGKINRLVRGKDTVDDTVLDELEEVLVTSDVGVKTTVDIIGLVEQRVAGIRCRDGRRLLRAGREAFDHLCDATILIVAMLRRMNHLP